MFPRLIKRTLGLLGGAMAAFHGWLFVAQAADGRLEDPWLVFRWVAAASLIAALVAVRRNGDSLWSRKGVAIWVLAALLHAPAVAGDAGTVSFALPESAATSVIEILASAALAFGLWTLAGLLRPRRVVARPVPGPVLGLAAASGYLAASITPQFCPRPPPARA